MFDERRRRRLRNWVITTLAFLVVQYEFGIAFIISDPPHLSPFSATSITDFNNALNRVGLVAQLHVSFGVLVGILAIVILVLSLRSGRRGVQIFGALGLLSILVSGIMGQLFVQSGYQNDNWSHGMATNFILAFIFYFILLYVLKPVARSETVDQS
jgi:heme A synthase